MTRERIAGDVVRAVVYLTGLCLAAGAVITDRSFTAVALCSVCAGNGFFHAGRAYAAHEARGLRSTAHRTT